jgi:cardiolipin synthase A/B
MVKGRRRRWPWIVLGCVAIVAALLLIAQDQETARVRSPLDARDPQFTPYVASLVGVPVSDGNAYQMLLNGDAIFPAMLQAIAKAEHRISFESFIYSGGEIARQFTSALTAAARRGVTVRIVLDSIGSMDLPKETVKELMDAGIQVVWFNPLASWSIEEVNYRTHRKVLVVDGIVAFTGGVGVADHWRGNARNDKEWRDTQFRATGPVVREFEAAFYENWLESGGREAPALDPPRSSQPKGARSLVVWSNPMSGISNVKLLYLLSIAGARRTIDIESPYVILDESTRWSLDRARERGVRIRILTESDLTDARPVKYASRYDYQALLESGFEIYEFTPTMMHVKAMTIDGVWSVIGSANFDNRSFELNDELTVAVSDKTLAARLIADFEADAARSKKLDAESWRDRSVLQKSREFFWSFFGEIF